jgi:sulfur-oxidizing protein SoxY
MSAANHVRAIFIIVRKNPRPVIAKMTFHAEFRTRGIDHTRIRLATSQRVVAVAQLSDGSFWSDTREVVVTETACLDAT